MKNLISILILMTDLLPEGEKIKIVDAGARGGLSDNFKNIADRLVVYGFEPNVSQCNYLNLEAKRKGWEHYYFPFCIGGSDGDRVFHIGPGVGDTSSLYLVDRDLASRYSIYAPSSGLITSLLARTEAQKDVILPVMTLDTWSKQNGIYDIDFIKLDIHGAECETLQRSTTLLMNCLGVQNETWMVPIYKGQGLFADCDIILRNAKFSFFSFFDLLHVGRTKSSLLSNEEHSVFCLKQNGQMISADALYLRDPLHYRDDDSFTWVKLLKLAIIADLFGQVDYACEILRFFMEKYPTTNAIQKEKVGNILHTVTKFYQKDSEMQGKLVEKIAIPWINKAQGRKITIVGTDYVARMIACILLSVHCEPLILSDDFQVFGMEIEGLLVNSIQKIDKESYFLISPKFSHIVGLLEANGLKPEVDFTVTPPFGFQQYQLW